MPRLSIIIPHRNNDQRFEATLLSVLENRPQDSEILAVHDGSYGDPYKLDDEVEFVVASKPPRGSSLGTSACQRLLNQGLYAASATVVCHVLDGVEIIDDVWSDEAMSLICEDGFQAVSVTIEAHDGSVQCGMDPRLLRDSLRLQRGKVDLTRDAESLGPTRHIGFFDRQSLRAVGGWDEKVAFEVCDVELALAWNKLQLPVCSTSAEIIAIHREPRAWNNLACKQAAELAVAYGVVASGTKTAMSELLRGVVTGAVSSAVSWASGLMHPRSNERVAARLELAHAELGRLNRPRLANVTEADLHHPEVASSERLEEQTAGFQDLGQKRAA